MDNKKRILIVEDDQFLREFYEELLTTEGYIVETASEGETGYSKIHQGGYDLVLLDLMLPKKDGVQILKDLQVNHPLNPNASIVVLTNLGQDSVIDTCFKLGISGYMIKSALNPDQVLVEVKNYLQASSKS